MEKIKNIEFLRIIGCFAIILYHFFNKNHINIDFFDINLYDKLSIMTSNGNKAVDLFFIISGFFFAIKLNLNQSLWSFLKKKIVRFYPVLIFLMLLVFIIALFDFIEWNFFDNILLLFGLTGTSLTLDICQSTHLSQFWYVSSILWVFALYFYLLKNYSKQNIDLTIALITFSSYALLIQTNNGYIGGAEQLCCFVFNAGMLRAFGGIGVGYLIAQWWSEYSDKIKHVSFGVFQTIIITVIEFICIYIIISNLILYKSHYKNQFIFIIIFAITLILFLIKKGIISKLLDNSICVIMGKYTYSIFMVHIFVYHILNNTLWEYYAELVFRHPILNVTGTISIVLILGMLVHHFIERPAIKLLVNRNKN